MADTDRHVTFEDEEEEIEVKGLTKGKVFAVLLAVVSLVVFVVFDMGFGQREYKGERPAQRCAGLVLFCAILWASDAVPSYITSLAVPLLAVMMRVMCVRATAAPRPSCLFSQPLCALSRSHRFLIMLHNVPRVGGAYVASGVVVAPVRRCLATCVCCRRRTICLFPPVTATPRIRCLDTPCNQPRQLLLRAEPFSTPSF